MGATKTEHFSKKQNQIAAIVKALGHPARIAIVEYLLKNKSCICTIQLTNYHFPIHENSYFRMLSVFVFSVILF